MCDQWYDRVGPEAELTQGDIIEGCPILEWDHEGVEYDQEEGTLRNFVEARRTDVIVMTQACDLAQDKVDEVIVCSAFPLADYKNAWERHEEARGQNPTERSWRKHCNRINRGYIWNLAIIDSATVEDFTTPHRVVDFHNTYTLPRGFIESYVVERGQHRFRLLPPYREHLSQSFARFFMRVGLPENVERVWQ